MHETNRNQNSQNQNQEPRTSNHVPGSPVPSTHKHAGVLGTPHSRTSRRWCGAAVCSRSSAASRAYSLCSCLILVYRSLNGSWAAGIRQRHQAEGPVAVAPPQGSRHNGEPSILDEFLLVFFSFELLFRSQSCRTFALHSLTPLHR